MPNTLEEFKQRCVARLNEYVKSKGEDTPAGHYFEDVSILLKLLSLQTVHIADKLYRKAKTF